jgi:hypothetical protein
MKKSIVIISFSYVDKDVRILKQIKALKDDFNLSVIGYIQSRSQLIKGVKYFELQKTEKNILLTIIYLTLGLLFPNFYNRLFWRRSEYIEARKIIEKLKMDFIHANDWEAIIVSNLKNKKTRIIFDSHEYFPEMNIKNCFERIIVGKYRKQLILSLEQPIFFKMVTVSPEIADLFKINFNWDAEVILNASKYHPHEINLCKSNQIRIVHHGHALKARKLEEIVKLLKYLDKRITVSFILIPTDKKYYNNLKKYEKKYLNRFFILPPVERGKLSTFLNKNFDLSIPAISRINLNNLYCLPNKLFESIIAGLAIINPGLPSISSFISKSNIGIDTPNKTRIMAEKINNLSIEAINHYKEQSLKLALLINEENEIIKYRKIYED